MNKFRTCPIGGTFEHEGVTLEVAKCTHICDGCYFQDYAGKCAKKDCYSYNRIDDVSVIFKKVN